MGFREGFGDVRFLGVTIVEPAVRPTTGAEVIIIGILVGDGGATALLSDAYVDYRVPAALDIDIAVDDLPINLKLSHNNSTIDPSQKIMEEALNKYDFSMLSLLLVLFLITVVF